MPFLTKDNPPILPEFDLPLVSKEEAELLIAMSEAGCTIDEVRLVLRGAGGEA